MARVLIVGCGCRGQALARALVADGHAVRGTTREPERFDAIRAAGAQPVLADPDRVGTLVAALDGVAVVAWLLGGADDPRLQGPRLAALLESLVDTPVRGFAWDGSAGAAPRALVEQARRTWRIPTAEMDADGWPDPGRAAVAGLLQSKDA